LYFIKCGSIIQLLTPVNFLTEFNNFYTAALTRNKCTCK